MPASGARSPGNSGATVDAGSGVATARSSAAAQPGSSANDFSSDNARAHGQAQDETRMAGDWTVQESYSGFTDGSVWLVVLDRGLMLSAFDTREEAELVLPAFVAAFEAGRKRGIRHLRELLEVSGQARGSLRHGQAPIGCKPFEQEELRDKPDKYVTA